jgi:hypothetical protein
MATTLEFSIIVFASNRSVKVTWSVFLFLSVWYSQSGRNTWSCSAVPAEAMPGSAWDRDLAFHRRLCLIPEHMVSKYSTYHDMQDAALAAVTPYPAERFAGRGIVICAGGARYFTCAWVLLRVLREVVGCTLPVEVWHLGPGEMDGRMSELLRAAGADTVDAYAVSGALAPAKGWPLKPFAILHSRFREVILMDADNVAIRDPAALFETQPYAELGCLFWPDLEQLEPGAPIWEICRVPYQHEPAFESGQLVVDKARCWKPLWLTMHMNEQADFYYRFLYGDKDTFHMALRMIGQPYGMISHPVRQIPAYRQAPWPEYWGSVMGHHDPEGTLVFQHKNFPKWVLFGFNPHYPQFRYENECLEFLTELASLWDGRVSTSQLKRKEPGSPESRWFRYLRLSCDEQLLEFLPDGRIGHGSGRVEKLWSLVHRDGRQRLEIWGEGFRSCILDLHSDGIWRGAWDHFERMPVELIPLSDGG